MARNLTPIVKQSRREAVALHPKAIKASLSTPTSRVSTDPTPAAPSPANTPFNCARSKW